MMNGGMMPPMEDEEALQKAGHMQAMRELKNKFSNGDMSVLPEEEMKGSPLLSILIGMGKKPEMEEEEEEESSMDPMASEEEQLRSA